MAPRLPSVQAKDVVLTLTRAGFVVDRQKGSHCVLRHPTKRLTTVVPIHPGDFPRPLLRLILKQCDISEEELRRLL